MSEVQKSVKRKKKNTRPPQFREFEKLAKSILEGKGVSYYEWLHKKHQEVINNFNVENMNKITQIAKEGD